MRTRTLALALVVAFGLTATVEARTKHKSKISYKAQKYKAPKYKKSKVKRHA